MEDKDRDLPIGALNNKTKSNYEIAKEYYRQRREIFEKNYNLNIEKNKEIFQSGIESIINNFFEKVVEEVYNNLDYDKETKMYTNNGAIEKEEGDNYQISYARVMNLMQGRQLQKRNVASFLGIEFENFLERFFNIKEFSKTINNITNEKIENEKQSLINQVFSGIERTGGKQSTSVVVKGKKDIRPDLGLNMSIFHEGEVAKYKDNDGGIHDVELQSFLDLSSFHKDLETKNIAEIIGNTSILEGYLNKNNTAFGFSLKLWKNANGKEFSQSSVLQKMVDAELREPVHEDKTRKSWESNYAMEYVIYLLSKYLINIIGPVNIAMITGGGLTWMNDFIDQKIFYMQVQAESILKKSNRGDGYEIYPTVSDPAIRIRDLNKSRGYYTSYNKKSKTLSIRLRKEIKCN